MNAYEVTYRGPQSGPGRWTLVKVTVVAPSEPTAVDALWDALRVPLDHIVSIENGRPAVVYGLPARLAGWCA
jgi:hypothetical protein